MVRSTGDADVDVRCGAAGKDFFALFLLKQTGGGAGQGGLLLVDGN
jgi:hypothetical protein